MSQSVRFTSADLEVLPNSEGKRYEIIDGELYVSRQPHLNHQLLSGWTFTALDRWSEENNAGMVAIAPGVIFAEDDDVAPDLVWISKERVFAVIGPDGKLYAAPDLIIEILSPGAANEKRDRDAKLKLYSRRGVREYWIMDWRRRQIEVYRRMNVALQLVATLVEGDLLQSPLLPGFSWPLSEAFARLPDLPY